MALPVPEDLADSAVHQDHVVLMDSPVLLVVLDRLEYEDPMVRKT